MITKLSSQQTDFNTQLSSLLSWESVSNQDVLNTVEEIINTIRSKGDKALIDYSIKFDGVKAKSMADLMISQEELEKSFNDLSDKQKNAITIAAERVKAYHLKQNQQTWSYTEEDGTMLGQKITPLDRVGLYVPGGKASYPSSVLMNAIPAKVAGVGELIMVVPTPNGKTNQLVLAAAYISGVDIVITVGGAQAIAALAYGTESVPKVDKIVGPGGKFVSIAKLIVSEQTSIDMIAGPTELGIIADSSANPELVALDLISQAEHSNDTMCFVITTSKTMAKQIQKLLEKLIPDVERSVIVKQSISKNGFIAVCKNEKEMVELANKIAPEHMELMVKNAKTLSKKITGAGLLLIGKNTPSSASDYLLGTNHILPTNGFGRTRGGLSVLDFLKLQTTVEEKKSGLKSISDKLKTLTDAEGLPNHYKAVKRRLD